MENHVQDQAYNLIDKPAMPSIAQLMEDGNLLNFGQTGVIVVNHAMEDLDGEHEKGAVPTQAQSMAEKNVLDLIQKQLLKNATHLLVLLMEDGNLLNIGQTGVIVVNHAMEDLDEKHEKGAVPTQAQSMAGKTVLDPIQKQLLKNATYLLVLIFALVTDQDTHITTHQMALS